MHNVALHIHAAADNGLDSILTGFDKDTTRARLFAPTPPFPSRARCCTSCSSTTSRHLDKTPPHEDYKMTGNARTREPTSQQATMNRKGAKEKGAGSCADSHLGSNTIRPPGRLHDLFTAQARLPESEAKERKEKKCGEKAKEKPNAPD